MAVGRRQGSAFGEGYGGGQAPGSGQVPRLPKPQAPKLGKQGPGEMPLMPPGPLQMPTPMSPVGNDAASMTPQTADMFVEQPGGMDQGPGGDAGVDVMGGQGPVSQLTLLDLLQRLGKL